MKTYINKAFILLLITQFGLAPAAHANPVSKAIIRETIEIATKKSGREIAEKSARETMEITLERSVQKFNGAALQATKDGGLELLEATAKHGEDFMQLATKASPSARRAFALNADELFPLAKQVGPSALEVEAKAPGLSKRFFSVFGGKTGARLAASTPAEDIPRLLMYGEKADSPATRELLVKAYQKEGKHIFERIPPKLVIATGLTASMLYGTHRITGSIGEVAKTIAGSPETASGVVNHALNVAGAVLLIVILALLWRFNLMPWQHRKTTKAETVATSNTDVGTMNPRSPDHPTMNKKVAPLLAMPSDSPTQTRMEDSAWPPSSS